MGITKKNIAISTPVSPVSSNLLTNLGFKDKSMMSKKGEMIKPAFKHF